MNIERHGTTRRYSDIVIHGETVYLVEIPQTLSADITTQTREVLASIELSLKNSGSDKSRLLQVTLYLPDLADYDAMNAVWDAWVPPGTAPPCPRLHCCQAGQSGLPHRGSSRRGASCTVTIKTNAKSINV